MLRFRLLGLSLFLLTPACGEKSDGSDTGGDDQASSGTEDDGSSTSANDSNAEGADASADGTTTTDDGGTTDGTTDTGGFDPIPARGIAITEVEANQGVATMIGQNDQFIPGPQRNARLVKERNTIIRLWHVIEPGWTPRVIEARLTLNIPGEDPIEFVQQKEITSDSNEHDLQDGFFFGLVAEEGHTTPGTTYQVSLWEVGPGGEGLSESYNINPADGPGEIGFEVTDMEMNVMFLPFHYVAAGTTPDLTDENNQNILRNQLYQQNPVTRVNAEFHAPIDYNQNFPGSVCNMLSTVNQIWQQEGAPGNVYYTGLIDTGAQSGTVGCAWLNSNINMNLWRNNKTSVAETVVHEIGHDQGLSHIECQAADAAGPDPSYPDHPNGRTLNTGFGITNFTLYPGDSTFDYMTYCGPTWTSDWTWGRVWNRIQNFTAQGDNVPFEPVLHHAIYPDGTEEYWTSVARIDPERLSGTHEVEFVEDGIVIAAMPSMVDTLSDGETIWVTTPLPEGGLEAEFDLVRDITAAGVSEVTVDNIKLASPTNSLN